MTHNGAVATGPTRSYLALPSPLSEIVHWPTGQFTGQLSTLPYLEHFCHVWVDFFPCLESVLPNLVGDSQLDNVDWTLSGQFQALA